MVSLVVQFLLLAAIVIVAGTVLARAADAIAEITGWGRLLIGSLLLAGGTSLPELTVDLSAVRLGLPNLAVGDLLGSSLMNLLLLAALDLTHHSRGRMLSREAAAHALSGTLSMALTALAGMGILLADRAMHWQALGVHVSTWLVALGYGFGVRMVFLDQRIAAQQAVAPGDAGAQVPAHDALGRQAAKFGVAALAILLVGPRLAHVAGNIAELSGWGDSFVGTTLVALTTSMPELVASWAAIRLGAYDLAIGNVFGSNAFNMALFVPLDMAFPGVLFAEAHQAHVLTVLSVVMCTSVAIMGQLYRSESRLRFLEPDAWLVVAMIGAAFFLVYATS